MRELEHDVTDLMTSRHLRVNGSLITRGWPALTVADLIELLGAYDPAEEVFVLGSCDCCLTGLDKLTPACVGLRDAFLDDIFEPDRSVDELIDAHEQAPRLSPLPLPPSRWLRRGVVIAGAPWVHYPEVTGAAALPGARHIDAELIATMADWREWKERDPAGFDAWRRAGVCALLVGTRDTEWEDAPRAPAAWAACGAAWIERPAPERPNHRGWSDPAGFAELLRDRDARR